MTVAPTAIGRWYCPGNPRALAPDHVEGESTLNESVVLAESNPLAVIVPVVVYGGTFFVALVCALDARKWSRQEYGQTFDNPNWRTIFVGAPVWWVVCGAGFLFALLYYVWGRPKLRRTVGER